MDVRQKNKKTFRLSCPLAEETKGLKTLRGTTLLCFAARETHSTEYHHIPAL